MPGINVQGFNGGDLLFCRKCKKPLLPDAVFCAQCGTKVHGALPDQPVAATAEIQPQPPAPPMYQQPAYQPPAPPAYQPPFAYEPIPVLPRTDLKPWAVALVSGICAFAVVAVALLVYLQATARWPF